MLDVILIASVVVPVLVVIVILRALFVRNRPAQRATHRDDGWIAAMPILHGTHHDPTNPAHMHHHHHDASCGHDAGGSDGGGDGGGGGGDGGRGGGGD